MVRRRDGKAARARRIALAASAAVVTLLVGACERDAEHDARSQHNRAQLPYQLALALPEAVTAPPVPVPALAKVEPRRAIAPAPAAPKAVPTMPVPTIAAPVAFVLDLPPPAAPATLPSLAGLPGEAPPAFVAALPTPEPAPAIVDAAAELTPVIAAAEPQFAATVRPVDEREVYIPQISQAVRAAYIAQVDAGGPEQRLAVRSGDMVLGSVQFQVTDGVVSVNIGQVLDLFEGQFDAARFAELRGSQAAQTFVSLDQLQGAGIPLEYNAAYDELTLAAQRG
jgi:hypothetical protein